MKQERIHLNVERRPAIQSLAWLWLLPLLTAMVWTGCKNTTKVAADANPAGNYTLVSIDGNKVPCTVSHEGASPSIKSGAFAINADGTCGSTIVFSTPSGGESTRVVKAHYTRDGSKLTMQWEGAGTTVGTVEGDTFSMNNEGMIFLYRK